jgi:hydrogenase maturation protease
MPTVIIGVGNPVRRDDGVGLRVARELRGRGVDVVELCAGGLRIMESMAGYDRAVVVDAIESGGSAGSVYRFGEAQLPATRNTGSTHDGSLPSALALGRAAGLRIPAEIRFWAVEAGDVETFGETLTPAVEAAVGPLVEAIWREVSA